MTPVKLSAVCAISEYLKSVGGDIGFDPYHAWLFAYYPHIRVQTIGDEPMIWHSVSRCNPPADSELSETRQHVLFLNEVAMLCSLEAGSVEADDLFIRRLFRVEP